jgi:hypothetical protein
MQQRSGILQPLLLATVIAVGLGAVWAVPTYWGLDVAKQWLGTERPLELLRFRTDGTPVIEVYKSWQYDENSTYRDLEGKPVAMSRQEAFLGNTYLPNAAGWEYDFWDSWPGGFRWAEQMVGHNDGGQPMTYWYFVCDGQPAGSGYFVGFNSVSRQCIGYLGRHGFQPDRPAAAERFPWPHRKVTMAVVVSSQYQSPSSEPIFGGRASSPGLFPQRMVYLVAGDGLVEVDLLKRSTRVAIQEPGMLSGCQLIRTLPTPMTTDSAAYLAQVKGYLAVRTQDRIEILNPAGQRQSSFAIPPEFRDARAFMFCLLSDKSAILDVPSIAVRSVPPHVADQWQLLWIDTQGNISRRKEYSVMRGDYSSVRFSPPVTALALPAPLAVATVSTVLAPWASLSLGEAPTYCRALAKSYAELWPALAAVCLLGAMLAGLVGRRQRRYGLPWTKTWMAFVFLGGLPALVGYYAHRRWPALENCSACGRAVPHDREACAGCGREFPEPAPRGTEIFG